MSVCGARPLGTRARVAVRPACMNLWRTPNQATMTVVETPVPYPSEAEQRQLEHLLDLGEHAAL